MLFMRRCAPLLVLTLQSTDAFQPSLLSGERIGGAAGRTSPPANRAALFGQEVSVAGVSALFGRRRAISRPLKATVEGATTANFVGEDPLLASDTKGDDGAEWAYDWRKQWYAVGYDSDIEEGPKPFGVSIFDEPLVLYRDKSGALQCVSDLCPHRASKLSEGQVTDQGNIECLYHGWQFEGAGGACVHIPQLPKDASPPRAASLRVYPLAVSEGVVFVWMGDDPWGEGAKDILPVPSTPDKLDETKPGFQYEFVYDLPYDWSYLAENLLDPAHIPISHHATDGGGDKKNAGPISFEVIKEGPDAPSPKGFSALVESRGFGKIAVLRKSQYWFEAPGIVRLRTVPAKEGGAVFGAALHCIPLGKGRSRLLFKTYGMGLPWALTIVAGLKPSALRHLNSCKILEQDMQLICAQEDHVARTGQSLSKSFLPVKSSDGLVVELRQWLDHVGHGMPHFVGWNKSKASEYLSDHENTQRYTHRANESRFHRHVVLSAATRKALRTVKRVRNGGLATAGALAAGAVLLSGAGGPPLGASVSAAVLARLRIAGVCGAVCSLVLGVAAGVFEGHFYTNFERHPVLG